MRCSLAVDLYRQGGPASPDEAVEPGVIALIQRVSEARVSVDAECVGAIGPGLLAFIAVEPADDEPRIGRMLERLLGYRVFPDAQGRMNRSVRDVDGELLLVSQFTLAADTRKGMRPGFSSAASPEHGRWGFEQLVAAARNCHPRVETGRFGAHMTVALVNDGPVTFWLQS